VFEGVLQQDPGCAIAYWGHLRWICSANSLGGAAVAAENAQRGPGLRWRKAARELARRTDRERGLDRRDPRITTEIMKRPTSRPACRAYKQRDGGRLAQRYHPDDYEVTGFLCADLARRRPSKTDMSYGNQLQVGHHPGKNCSSRTRSIRAYRTSSFTPYDFPPLAERGIAAAKRYGGIARRRSRHGAGHMPLAHLFDGGDVGRSRLRRIHPRWKSRPDYYHAADFTVYAHLQLGAGRQGESP